MAVLPYSPSPMEAVLGEPQVRGRAGQDYTARSSKQNNTPAAPPRSPKPMKLTWTLMLILGYSLPLFLQSQEARPSVGLHAERLCCLHPALTCMLISLSGYVS